MPPDKRARRKKPTITPAQFNNLIEFIPEPYATMIYVAVWTGLRISELIALKWRCIHADSITIEERYFRGDWSVPKTQASAATIGVSPEVISRIVRLKTLTVEIRAGRAIRQHKLVKSCGDDDLGFSIGLEGKTDERSECAQETRSARGSKLGLYVNWRCLRTSHATWMVQAGAESQKHSGPDASHANIDDHGYIRSDRASRAAAGDREAIRVR